MRINNLTIEKWRANHSPYHKDKWYRELYPFHVFGRIDFDENKIGIVQKISFSAIYYYATVNKIEPEEQNRWGATFQVSTFPASKSQTWKQGTWNTIFKIIYSEKYDFITVFTDKKDPSKDYVKSFKCGNFTKISDNRSLQISDLLFRTLLLNLSEENFQDGIHDKLYRCTANGIRDLTEHPQFKRRRINFAPLYSLNRDLWICHSFTEEKAHRIAFFTANQCEKLIVVYCNPTYTKHHRCDYDNTLILSLYEFADMISPQIRIKYESHIRFLQNHLNPIQNYDCEALLHEIHNPSKEIYIINKSDLMESLGVIKIIPSNNIDFFHALAAGNLINAFISQHRKQTSLNSREATLLKDMYNFKTHLAAIITARIKNKDFSIPIFIKGNEVIIEIFDLKFSFHSVPMNAILFDYEKSDMNKEIKWSGKRMQPIAPLLLNYSRALRQTRR